MKAISRNDLILAFSKTIDLLDKKLYKHHWLVAYISLQIGLQMALSQAQIDRIILASLLHDIGVFKTDDRKKLLDYNDLETVDHEEIGALLLEEAAVLQELAPIIRAHHLPYNQWSAATPREAGVIYLADRISVILDKSADSEQNYQAVIAIIEPDRDIKFSGEMIDAFKRVAANSFFWLDIEMNREEARIRPALSSDEVITSFERMMAVGHLFITAVDFRSRFTAAHSYGVSAVVKKLASLLGLTAEEQQFLELAGFYHDIGKIAIPKEILDKPAALTAKERRIIRGHSYFTYDILASVDGLTEYAAVAAHHHESLDGMGYPFGLEGNKIDLRSRILAVADIFTAITEQRPYRPSIDKGRAKSILAKQAANGKIDTSIVEIAVMHFDELFKLNQHVQEVAYRRFDKFERAVKLRTHTL